MYAALNIAANQKAGLRLICTPKVGQTFGGAYFHVKRKKISNKVLARV